MNERPGDAVAGLIAEFGRLRSLAPGEFLFLEGDHPGSVYVCASGRVRIFLTLASGRQLTMGVKTPGDLFGELSALDHRPRAASAIADVASTVVTMPGDDFLDALHHAPDLGVAVLGNLAEQLRRANARLRARNGESAFVRTGHQLIELSSLHLRHGRDPDRVELKITQDDLADWIGATRESTARALSRYRKAGVLRTARCRITVDDLPGLVRLVESA